MPLPHPQKQWNEFDWEEAFKEDDQRIRAYMNELPTFIDLPHEEDVLLAQLEKRYHLAVPPQKWDDAEDDEFDGETEPPPQPETNPQNMAASEILETLGKFSNTWDRLYATKLTPENDELGLAICCLFGTALTRLADILDDRWMEDYPFKCALAKRLLQILSNLIAMMEKMSHRAPELDLQLHVMHVRELCEKTVQLIYDFQSMPPARNP